MSNLFIFLAISFSLLLGGCQSEGTIKPDATPTVAPKAEAAKPTLSEEANQALAKAEADVKEAKSKAALWTTAEVALKKAQEAAAKGDSAATTKSSKTASEHAQLGLAQKNYPSTK